MLSIKEENTLKYSNLPEVNTKIWAGGLVQKTKEDYRTLTSNFIEQTLKGENITAFEMEIK